MFVPFAPGEVQKIYLNMLTTFWPRGDSKHQNQASTHKGGNL